MIVRDYADAAAILVPDVRDVQVYSGEREVALDLWRDGILRGAGWLGSVGFALAREVAGAIGGEVVPVAAVDLQRDAEALLVAPTFYRATREARTALRVDRGVRVVYHKRTRDAESCLAFLDSVADKLALATIALDSVWVVSEIEIEPLDDDAFVRDLDFCGAIEITLTTGRA